MVGVYITLLSPYSVTNDRHIGMTAIKTIVRQVYAPKQVLLLNHIYDILLCTSNLESLLNCYYKGLSLDSISIEIPYLPLLPIHITGLS